jgi:hypothetical protein
MGLISDFWLWGAIWGAVFFYFHLYRPPRKLHNDNDLNSSLEHIADYLQYDIIDYTLRPDGYDENLKLYIISHPGLSEGLIQALEIDYPEQEK